MNRFSAEPNHSWGSAFRLFIAQMSAWLLISLGASAAGAAETQEPKAAAPSGAEVSDKTPQVRLAFTLGQKCATAPVLRPEADVRANATDHKDGAPQLYEGVIRTILQEGPTEKEAGEGLRNALPRGSRLVQLEVPEPDSVVIRLELPPSPLTNGRPSAHMIEHFGDQIHEALIPLGVRQFTFLYKDPDTGEFRKPRDFYPPAPAPEPEDNSVVLADTGGVVPKAAAGIEKSVVPSNTGRPAGALTGKTVVLNQAHGWLDDDRGATTAGYPNRWRVQRTKIFDTLEDYSCPELLNLYVIPALHNVGAKVHTVREPDLQTNMVIVDNTTAAPRYEEVGTWGTSSATRGWVPPTLPISGANTDPFANASATRFTTVVSGAPTATATFNPNIPAAGFYNVYVTHSSGTNRPTAGHIQVHHSGGVTDYYVDQTKDGATWLLLGNFYFESGTAGKVVVLNDGAGADVGKAVIADAVRFGGGMGDVARRIHGVSGKPRWQEECINYLQYIGGWATGSNLRPDITQINTNNTGNPYFSDEEFGWSRRPRYASWELTRDSESASNFAYVGWHTNAAGSGCAGAGTTDSGSGARGTAAFRDVDADATAFTEALTEACQAAVVDNLKKTYNADWRERSTRIVASNSYGECSQGNLGSVPGFFFEGLFADEEDDNLPWRDPKFRATVARGIVQGLITYWGGTTFPPESPTHLRVRNQGSNQVKLDWTAGPVRTPTMPYGSAATSYLVYRSTNGFGFDNGTPAASNTLTVSVTPGQVVYFRVAAVNSAGVSFPTETLAVRAPAAGLPSLLVVNGSDRTDGNLPSRVASSGVGGCSGSFPNTVRTGDWRTFQRFNYIIQHATAIGAANVAFDSCANECIENGQVSLGSYSIVDWIGGQEAEAYTYDPEDNTAIKPAAQTAIQNYLAAGGKLFMSTAELAWDFDRASQPAGEVAFMTNYMKARYSADSSNTFTAQGAAGSIFAGVASFTFDNGTGGTYEVRFPDVLTATGGSSAALNYVGGTGGVAAIQYTGNFGVGTTPGKLVYMGFPFETIINQTTRNTVMANILNYFGASSVEAWPIY